MGPDECECGLICFIRRIINDRLFLRSRGGVAPWAVGVATAMGTRVCKAASFGFAPFEIISTHMVLVYRWRLVVWPGSILALGWISCGRVPSSWALWVGVALFAGMSLCRLW